MMWGWKRESLWIFFSSLVSRLWVIQFQSILLRFFLLFFAVSERQIACFSSSLFHEFFSSLFRHKIINSTTWEVTVLDNCLHVQQQFKNSRQWSFLQFLWWNFDRIFNNLPEKCYFLAMSENDGESICQNFMKM